MALECAGPRGERSLRRRRLAIAVLCGLGLADALYMLAYDEGAIDSLVCPFFGEGCNIVGRSEHAQHLGVPNAAVGAVGYACMASLALWSGGHPPDRRRWQPIALAGLSGAAVATSAFLTWEQGARVKAWCFWCLLSALINVVVLLLNSTDAVKAWRSWRSSGHDRAVAAVVR